MLACTVRTASGLHSQAEIAALFLPDLSMYFLFVLHVVIGRGKLNYNRPIGGELPI